MGTVGDLRGGIDLKFEGGGVIKNAKIRFLLHFYATLSWFLGKMWDFPFFGGWRGDPPPTPTPVPMYVVYVKVSYIWLNNYQRLNSRLRWHYESAWQYDFADLTSSSHFPAMNASRPPQSMNLWQFSGTISVRVTTEDHAAPAFPWSSPLREGMGRKFYMYVIGGCGNSPSFTLFRLYLCYIL